MIQEINIKDIQINPENFRHQMMLTEYDAQLFLINNSLNETIDLCQSFIEHGFWEQDSISLLELEPAEKEKTGYKYTALDGNRRITCLKLLNNMIELPKSRHYEKIRNYLKNIPIKTKVESIVPCKIYKRIEDAYDYIKDKHFRPGSNVKAWDIKAQRRFNKRIYGEITVTQSILDAVDPKLYESLLSVSTVDRIFNSEESRILLGVNNITTNKKLNDKTKKIIKKIVNDVNAGAITTRSINTKNSKNLYIDNLLKENENNILEEKPHEETDVEPFTQEEIYLLDSTKPKNNSGNVVINTKKTRRTIIPKYLNFKFFNQKMNQIISELQCLNTNIHTFACALLLRTFIDLVLQKYSLDNTVKYKYQENNLYSTLQSAINKTFSNNKDKNLLISINDLLKKDDFIALLNGYVHDLNTMPYRDSLIDGYDILYPFFNIVLNGNKNNVTTIFD